MIISDGSLVPIDKNTITRDIGYMVTTYDDTVTHRMKVYAGMLKYNMRHNNGLVTVTSTPLSELYKSKLTTLHKGYSHMLSNTPEEVQKRFDDARFTSIITCVKGAEHIVHIKTPYKQFILIGERHDEHSIPNIVTLMRDYVEHVRGIPVDLFIETTIGITDEKRIRSTSRVTIQALRVEWARCISVINSCGLPDLRVHWTDPCEGQTGMLNDVLSILATVGTMKTFDETQYSLLTDQIKHMKDLSKVILLNKTMLAEVNDVSEHYKKRFNMTSIETIFWNVYRSRHQYGFDMDYSLPVLGVFMSRFSVDVYTVARMLKDGPTGHRMRNIFYGGKFHTNNILTILEYVFESNAVIKVYKGQSLCTGVIHPPFPSSSRREGDQANWQANTAL